MAQARTLTDAELDKALAYAQTTKAGLRNRAILLLTHLAGMDEDTEVFLRMCQMIAVLGSYLHDIALKLSGDGIADYMTQVGGINVTKQVEAGLIPVEQFH